MPIIKNIGYMWHRKYVNWDETSLGGYSDNDDTFVDFAYQAGIYALYNQTAECIYIGQAGRGDNNGLFHRLKSHALDDDLFCMWKRFSWYGFYSAETVRQNTDNAYENEFSEEIFRNINELMNVIESMIIRIHTPKFNKSVGSLKKDRNTGQIEWFYQKAEIEDRVSEFNAMRERCESLRQR